MDEMQEHEDEVIPAPLGEEKLSNPDDFQWGGVYSTSKIIQYGLEDLTYSCLMEKRLSVAKTVKALNDELRKRKDGRVYKEVNDTNVYLYLRRLKTQLASRPGASSHIDELPNILVQLRTNINKLVDKFDEMIDEGTGVGDMVKVHDALHKDMKFLAALEGRLKTYVTVETFTTNVMQIVDVIEKDSELTSRDKRRLLYKIGQVVYPKHDSATLKGLSDEIQQSMIEKEKVLENPSSPNGEDAPFEFPS